MARIRSPNYPQFSLPEAVRRVAPVFEKERQNPMPKEVLAKHLGYGGVNGASLGAISAMLKYGLVAQEGENYRVADRTISILHPQNIDEKSAAMREAAFEPALFAELAEHFKGGPPSDENLRAYLIRRGFANSALSGVIEAFRETIGVIPQDSAVPGPMDPPKDTKPVQTPTPPSAPSVPIAAADNVLRVAVSDNRLEVSASLLDQKGVDRLIRVLQANRELLPEELPPPLN